MNTSIEIFKTIEIAPNYEVSNLGRVKNKTSGNFLSIAVVTKGYLSTHVVMTKYNKSTSVKLHRLVAETFIGKKIGYVIDHVDNDKTNNRVDNLVYVTNRYNIVKQKLNSNNFIQKMKKGKPFRVEYRKNDKKFQFTASTEMECVIHYCNKMLDTDQSVISLLEKHYNFNLKKL